MGFVYLILETDKHGEESHKIGVTKNDPLKRNKGLQTGNSNPIRVLYTYESENYLKIEKWLHRKYSNNQTLAKNEWFYLNDTEVLSFITECKKADTTISFLKQSGNPFV